MSDLRRFVVSCLLLSAASALGCAREVAVGAIISDSGEMAVPYGRQVKRGLDLALEEINASGGFQGNPVRLIYRDDKSDPEEGRIAAKELIETEGVKVIVGAISSPVTLSIAPICEQNRVVLLSPSSSSPQITTAGDYIFRNYPSDVLEGTAMADFARGLGLKRIVIISQDNEFGEGLREVFTKRFASETRQVLQSFKVRSGNLEQILAQTPQVKQLEPDGIYLAAYHDEMIRLLKGLHEAEVQGVIMGSSSVTEETMREAGAAAEQLVYAQPSFDVKSTEPAVTAFVTAYRARYNGDDPDIYAAHGYDALKLLWQAMIDTGAEQPDEVRRGLTKLDGYQGAAGRTAFDQQGDVIRYPQLFVVQGGTATPYEKFQQDGGQLSVPEAG